MIKTEFSKSILVPLLCTIIMLNIETLKTFTKLQTRQFESDSKECIQIWKNNERFWRREERESDLRLFADGRDEIKEEIEAEESSEAAERRRRLWTPIAQPTHRTTREARSLSRTSLPFLQWWRRNATKRNRDCSVEEEDSRFKIEERAWCKKKRKKW